MNCYVPVQFFAVGENIYAISSPSNLESCPSIEQNPEETSQVHGVSTGQPAGNSTGQLTPIISQGQAHSELVPGSSIGKMQDELSLVNSQGQVQSGLNPANSTAQIKSKSGPSICLGQIQSELGPVKSQGKVQSELGTVNSHDQLQSKLISVNSQGQAQRIFGSVTNKHQAQNELGQVNGQDQVNSKSNLIYCQGQTQSNLHPVNSQMQVAFDLGSLNSKSQLQSKFLPVNSQDQVQNKLVPVNIQAHVQNELNPVKTHSPVLSKLGSIDSQDQVQSELGPIMSQGQVQSKLGQVNSQGMVGLHNELGLVKGYEQVQSEVGSVYSKLQVQSIWPTKFSGNNAISSHQNLNNNFIQIQPLHEAGNEKSNIIEKHFQSKLTNDLKQSCEVSVQDNLLNNHGSIHEHPSCQNANNTPLQLSAQIQETNIVWKASWAVSHTNDSGTYPTNSIVNQGSFQASSEYSQSSASDYSASGISNQDGKITKGMRVTNRSTGGYCIDMGRVRSSENAYSLKGKYYEKINKLKASIQKNNIAFRIPSALSLHPINQRVSTSAKHYPAKKPNVTSQVKQKTISDKHSLNLTSLDIGIPTTRKRGYREEQTSSTQNKEVRCDGVSKESDCTIVNNQQTLTISSKLKKDIKGKLNFHPQHRTETISESNDQFDIDNNRFALASDCNSPQTITQAKDEDYDEYIKEQKLENLKKLDKLRQGFMGQYEIRSLYNDSGHHSINSSKQEEIVDSSHTLFTRHECINNVSAVSKTNEIVKGQNIFPVRNHSVQYSNTIAQPKPPANSSDTPRKDKEKDLQPNTISISLPKFQETNIISEKMTSLFMSNDAPEIRTSNESIKIYETRTPLPDRNNISVTSSSQELSEIAKPKHSDDVFSNFSKPNNYNHESITASNINNIIHSSPIVHTTKDISNGSSTISKTENLVNESITFYKTENFAIDFSVFSKPEIIVSDTSTLHASKTLISDSSAIPKRKDPVHDSNTISVTSKPGHDSKDHFKARYPIFRINGKQVPSLCENKSANQESSKSKERLQENKGCKEVGKVTANIATSVSESQLEEQTMQEVREKNDQTSMNSKGNDSSGMCHPHPDCESMAIQPVNTTKRPLEVGSNLTYEHHNKESKSSHPTSLEASKRLVNGETLSEGSKGRQGQTGFQAHFEQSLAKEELPTQNLQTHNLHFRNAMDQANTHLKKSRTMSVHQTHNARALHQSTIANPGQTIQGTYDSNLPEVQTGQPLYSNVDHTRPQPYFIPRRNQEHQHLPSPSQESVQPQLQPMSGSSMNPQQQNFPVSTHLHEMVKERLAINLSNQTIEERHVQLSENLHPLCVKNNLLKSLYENYLINMVKYRNLQRMRNASGVKPSTSSKKKEEDDDDVVIIEDYDVEAYVAMEKS